MIDAPDFTAASSFQFAIQREAPALRLAEVWPLMPVAVPSPPAQFGEEVVRDLATLGADWDGYGALAIDPLTISNATTAIRALLPLVPKPDVTPNPNGTISFEWESGIGLSHLEIGKTKYSFYGRSFSGRPIHGDGLASAMALAIPGIAAVVRAAVYPAHNETAPMTIVLFAANNERRRF